MTLSTVVMEELECWDCGIRFAVPKRWIRNKEDETIHCPNGHEVAYYWNESEETLLKKIEKLQAENKDLKERLFKALHMAEQAEGHMEAAKESTPAIPPEKPQHGKEKRICPVCRKEYRLYGSFLKHIKHSHPDKDFRQLAEAADQGPNKR
ncbi:MAG: hypothetical protein IT446_14195 [Phycisphaerales bacterium]|nr:hypothetical protein [Phycisphaerales bacterium]